MTHQQTLILRCAVYARKSSEEGLDQSFNSLDAQREACEAFILSQRQEGWRVLSTRYDDGGYSGGSMERPALKRLLEDVEAGKVNVIVVYKVDRLTRSLADFAKIVEVLDSKGASFVSITQQFNTTTSMGRLTLNILLSFAQFEREVTGERIRDKIAASKRKGMWMGGPVPLGYNLEKRKLIPHPVEATFVCRVYNLYLELGCVVKLAAHLCREDVRTKCWTTRAGVQLGGQPFSPGHLYYLLRNRLYIGEIRHRDRWYPGEHAAIVPRDLWERVQNQLDSNLQVRRNQLEKRSSSLLTGLIKDREGNRFTPSFTVKRGKRYRYYVSQVSLSQSAERVSGPTRLPAHEVECRVTERLCAFLKSDAELFDALSSPRESPARIQSLMAAAKKLAAKCLSVQAHDLRQLLLAFLRNVIVCEDRIELLVGRAALRQVLSPDKFVSPKEESSKGTGDPDDAICLTVEVELKHYRGNVHLVVPPNGMVSTRHPRPALIKAVARGWAWYEKVMDGKVSDIESLAREAGLTPHYVRNVFACAFLAPDIVEAILDGRQPLGLKFEDLYKHIPLSWTEQREQFGFAPRTSR
jgi:DNA invertase Pin-like site-specific DNA recombinase